MLQPNDVSKLLEEFAVGKGNVFDLYGDVECGGRKEIHMLEPKIDKKVTWRIELDYLPAYDITKVVKASRVDGDPENNRTTDHDWGKAYGMNPWDLVSKNSKLKIKERAFKTHTETGV